MVGLGIGRLHLFAWQSLSDRFEIAGVCDVDPKALERGGGDLPRLDWEAALADRSIDIIDLCTPPHLHVHQIEEALAAGKHVVCEKPVAGSLRDLDRLQEAEEASGRTVMPVFQYRFGAGLQKLHRLVTCGVAGEPLTVTIEVAWRRRDGYYAVPWRGKWATERGGVVLSHAQHGIDMATLIVGPVKAVSSRMTTKVNPIETEDCAAAILETESGALITLSATLGSSTEISRHRFCFSRLVAESNTFPYTNSSEPWTFTGDSPEDGAAIEECLDDFTATPEGYAGQFGKWTPGEHPPVTLADARAALEIVTAMYHAAEVRREVTLPITPDHPAYGGWRS